MSVINQLYIGWLNKLLPEENFYCKCKQKKSNYCSLCFTQLKWVSIYINICEFLENFLDFDPLLSFSYRIMKLSRVMGERTKNLLATMRTR